MIINSILVFLRKVLFFLFLGILATNLQAQLNGKESYTKQQSGLENMNIPLNSNIELVFNEEITKIEGGIKLYSYNNNNDEVKLVETFTFNLTTPKNKLTLDPKNDFKSLTCYFLKTEDDAIEYKNGRFGRISTTSESKDFKFLTKCHVKKGAEDIGYFIGSSWTVTSDDETVAKCLSTYSSDNNVLEIKIQGVEVGNTQIKLDQAIPIDVEVYEETTPASVVEPEKTKTDFKVFYKSDSKELVLNNSTPHKPGKISVFNLLGTLQKSAIFKQESKSHKISIELSKGFYIACWESKNQKICKNFVVTN